MTDKVTTQHIDWRGKQVCFRRMPDGDRFVRTRLRIGHEDVCPLCKKRFGLDNVTSVTLIISNQVNVPNRFVHDECLARHTLEHAFKLIADDYEAAKAHAHWFPSSV